MTTLEIVDLLKGRPAGTNRWFARCPVHEEKSGSVSIRAGTKATLLYCFGCHAKAPQIMGALGLTAQHTFFDNGRKMTREQREAFQKRKRQDEELKRLQLRWSIALWSVRLYPAEKQWRLLVEANAWRALKHHDLEMDPERKARYLLAKEIRSVGFDTLWERLEESAAWGPMMDEVRR